MALSNGGQLGFMVGVQPGSEPVGNADLEIDVQAAKTYLLRKGSNGVCMYDHLVDVLTNLLDSRPENTAGLLEQVSRKVEGFRCHPAQDTMHTLVESEVDTGFARDQMTLFEPQPNPDREDLMMPDEEEDLTVLPNIMENAFFFEQAGVGLAKEELFKVALALKQLVQGNMLKSCRFWGKIIGLKANYLVAEVEFVDGQDPGMDIGGSGSEDEDDDNAQGYPDSPDLPTEVVEDELPKSAFEPPAKIPAEHYGKGCNKKVYFVCNEPGLPWQRLPPVSPEHIRAAQQIRKFLTGDLQTALVAYPPFEGTEAHYLRAQIARITAATHVSPNGFYAFEEDEDDADSDPFPEDVIPNGEFEPLGVTTLCDASLMYWVHHTPFILPQGRTVYYKVILQLPLHNSTGNVMFYMIMLYENDNFQ